MYHTTGFTRDEIIDLCVMVRSAGQEPGLNHWPPILGLFKSVVVALTYMRRNRVQAELAEAYSVSQPTISRAVTGITPLLGKALKKYVPTADQLDGRTDGRSTSWTARCSRAGHGGRTRNCTPVSIKPRE